MKFIIDDASKSDRLFFEANPHRQYRLRAASRRECAHIALVEPVPPSTFGYFAAVKQIVPGVRHRLFFAADFEPSLRDEVTAKKWFENVRRALDEGDDPA